MASCSGYHAAVHSSRCGNTEGSLGPCCQGPSWLCWLTGDRCARSPPVGMRATKVNDFEYFWSHWQKQIHSEMNEIMSYLDIIKQPNLLSLLILQDTINSLFMIWHLRKVPTRRECRDHTNCLCLPPHNSAFSYYVSTEIPAEIPALFTLGSECTKNADENVLCLCLVLKKMEKHSSLGYFLLGTLNSDV